MHIESDIHYAADQPMHKTTSIGSIFGPSLNYISIKTGGVNAC